MNKRTVRWLYQELPDLVHNGVLTAEAAEKIRQHYGEVKSIGKKWFVLIICGVLGALFIGLGIILLLAHNWEQFSRFTRAILSFMPLMIGQLLAFWVLWKRPESHAFKEGTATFLSLMVGASIALVSQTYNIPGDTSSFILTWMLLIAPLVYLMQASLPAAIYLGGITAWAGSSWDNPAQAILFWPLAVVVVPHFIWALRREIYTIRATILAVLMAICVCFGAGFSLGKTWPGLWIIIYSSIFAILFLIGNKKIRGITTNWQRPFRVIGGIGIFMFSLQLTFRFAWKSITWGYRFIQREPSGLVAFFDYSITLAVIATALLLFYDNVKQKDLMKSIFGAVPLLAIVSYSFSFQTIALPLLLFNVYLFILSVSCIMTGVRNNNLGTINTGMLMLAILILARFFDSNINFVLKGLVFIVVGIGFLVTNAVLVHRRGGEQ